MQFKFKSGARHSWLEECEAKRKEFIKFANTLQCPICKSGLDGSLYNRLNEHAQQTLYKTIQLYCISNTTEYTCEYQEDNFQLVQDRIIFYVSNKIFYEIIHIYSVNKEFRTIVNISDYPNNKKSKIIDHCGEIIFDASSFNKQDFLEKVELYNTFL